MQEPTNDPIHSDFPPETPVFFFTRQRPASAPLTERVRTLRQTHAHFSDDMLVGPTMTLRERIELLWALGVSPEVVHTALAVSAKIDAIPEFNVKSVRAAMDRVTALETAVEETRVFQRQLEDEVLRSRAELGRDSVGLYHALRRLARSPEGAHLRPAAKAMRDVIEGRGRKAARNGSSDDGSAG